MGPPQAGRGGGGLYLWKKEKSEAGERSKVCLWPGHICPLRRQESPVKSQSPAHQPRGESAHPGDRRGPPHTCVLQGARGTARAWSAAGVGVGETFLRRRGDDWPAPRKRRFSLSVSRTHRRPTRLHGLVARFLGAGEHSATGVDRPFAHQCRGRPGPSRLGCVRPLQTFASKKLSQSPCVSALVWRWRLLPR